MPARFFALMFTSVTIKHCCTRLNLLYPFRLESLPFLYEFLASFYSLV